MNISLVSIKKTFHNFLQRFHLMIFVIVVLGGLVLVVLTLNDIIVSSGESNGYVSTGSNASFDQATIDQINQLKTSDQAGSQLDLSQGRTNPFVE